MRCPIENYEGTQVLLDYVASRLGAARVAVLERHLATCLRCSEFTLRQGKVWQALDTWTAPAVNQNFDQRLLEKICRRPHFPGVSKSGSRFENQRRNHDYCAAPSRF